jgi:hypothetical protein
LATAHNIPVLVFHDLETLLKNGQRPDFAWTCRPKSHLASACHEFIFLGDVRKGQFAHAGLQWFLLNSEMLDGLANSIDEAAQNDWANYSPECYSNRLSHRRGLLAELWKP